MHFVPWLIPRSIRVRAIHQPEINNELANDRSHNHLDPTEWHLTEKVVLQLFQLWRHPSGGLVHESLEPPSSPLVLLDWSPIGCGLRLLSQPWTGLSLYAFPPILLLERTLVKIREDHAEEVIVIAPSWQGGPGTISSRWHARSLSCSEVGGISCHNACLIRAHSSMPT